MYWILVDTALGSHTQPQHGVQDVSEYKKTQIHLDATTNGTATQPRHVLASCESLRKRAFISRGGKLEDETVWGIGSVFVREEYRGKGYAGRMMDELGKKLETWGQGDGKKTAFTVLYSDIGKVSTFVKNTIGVQTSVFHLKM